MEKIVYLPLDERPCNYYYPQMLAKITDLQLIVPDRAILGRKKKPAIYEKLRSWLLDYTKGANFLIVSIDMLVYGGIVPSRLHHLTLEECENRLSLLREIKKINPSLKIYGFNLIMRTPSYNSNEEEPDYYGQYGQDIFRYGYLSDKKESSALDREEENEWLRLQKAIPENILNDFLKRRHINHQINLSAINYVNEGIIDYLIIPLDDNSRYGFTPKEQRLLTMKIEELNLVDQILTYPGADEVGCTLFARVFSKIKQYNPKVFVKYSSTKGPFIIPKLEDRTLNESIKSQLSAVNAFLTDYQNADFVLMINSPATSENMADCIGIQAKDRSYYSEINYREFLQSFRYFTANNTMVALADVSIINGSDHTLMKILSKNKLIEKIEAYAGWNTSGNSLGTVISHAVIHSYYRHLMENNKKMLFESRKFYYYRLIEDWGYQAIVRQQVSFNELPRLKADYFNVSISKNEIENIICEQLNNFINEYSINREFSQLKVQRVNLPWNRMFEVEFEIKL